MSEPSASTTATNSTKKRDQKSVVKETTVQEWRKKGGAGYKVDDGKEIQTLQSEEVPDYDKQLPDHFGKYKMGNNNQMGWKEKIEEEKQWVRKNPREAREANFQNHLEVVLTTFVKHYN